jgi:FKBP-type peptidyl-prolyl cis-trans isomerase
MDKLTRAALAALLAGSLLACKDKPKSQAEPQPTADLPDQPGKDRRPHKPRNQVPAPPDVGAVPDDAQKTPSGLAFRQLAAGTSDERPGANDTVFVHYTGWKSTGEMFITTSTRKAPQPMSLATSAPGWREALAAMAVGEKRRLWMTPALAFHGQRATRDGELMVYDVELVSIKRAPPTPEDLAAPPPGTPTTRSGIAFRTLTPGTGKQHPAAWDEVTIHFSAWAKDGRLIASSVMNDKPQTFAIYRKGEWYPEVLATLTVGQKSRFWIPGALTTRPADEQLGDTVFDIELISLRQQQQPPPVPEHVAAPPADAVKTPGGVSYQVLARGSGKVKPTPQHLIQLHFTIWTADGKMQDSSVVRGEPTDYAMNRLPVPAWAEVLEQMVAGEKRLVWVPADRMPGHDRAKEQGGFVFQLELVSVRERPKAPPPPKDVAGPPAGAAKTDKGVFYVVLAPGTGKEHPGPRDRVKVNYTGWTTDGKQFDSSIPNGEPASFRVNGVIPGWTDGLQTMVVGEKKRMWIPEELAYKDKPGRPQGMLVFDVELVEIVKAPDRRKPPTP